MKTNLKVLGQTKQVSLMGDIISSYNALSCYIADDTHKNITKQYNSNKNNNNGVCVCVLCQSNRATDD